MTPRLHNLLVTSTALLALGSVYAGAQPTGPNVVGGNATVTGAGTNSVIVNQTSDRAIINWNTFNVSTGGSATFNQPGTSSITLNRVTGGLGPSVIDGTISANGRVFIINRDGMLFGRNAVINTAGFLATTNDIRNADFMAGRMNFNIPGRGDASIINYGNITASSGGFAALVAPGVRNAGTISANLGTVTLASGNSFTLDMYGDKLIQVAVGDEIAGKVIDVSTGKPLSSLVTNEGTLRANGGRVEITAAAARHIVDSVINNKGVIEANSIGTRNGRIVLGGATQTAGLPKQTIKISGKITATGKDKGQKGGTIQITGEDIQFAAAMLDVSGHSGGGKILVGGDYGGSKPIPGIVNNQSAVLEGYAIPTASTVTVDAATTFNASATANGHGGKVILWSDVLTTFAGTIFARGGEQGGNGGFVEVSGKQSLAFTGTVNTLAPQGAAGTLLLDPYNVTISNDADSSHTSLFAANANDSVINVGTLQTALATNNVIVSTGSGGDQSGNITVASALTWTAATTLALQAHNEISINAPITAVNGGLTISAGGDITAPAAINVGTFTLANGNWTQNSATLPGFHATDFRITGGSFLRVTGGGGSENPYQIADVYGLQGIGSSKSFLSGNWQLANDIDSSVTATWNGGSGFRPIGNGTDRFSGSLAGEGFVISGLTIASTQQYTGLFGYIGSTASVGNLGLANVNVVASERSGSGWVGSLAGRSDGSISRVYATGTVAANDTSYDVGGLVGRNDGTISQSYTSVSTSGGNFSAIGGMAGRNYGTIRESYSLGSVTTGNSSYAGGLVGWNDGNGFITQTYATGAVSAGTGSQAGGLVGVNAIYATVSDSYWDIGTTGQATSAGGGTGLQTADARNQANYSDLDFGVEGAWFMIDGQTRPFLKMEHSTTIRNSHQLQLMAMNLGASYVLANDIDFTRQFNDSGMWGTRGFSPIGSAGNPFAGSLSGLNIDGPNFAIKGLVIAQNNSTLQSIGLFGTIGANGAVSDLRLTNANVSANIGFDSSVFSQWVGIVAGQSGGTITNVHATGTVSGLSAVGVIAGGLVGQHGILGNESAHTAGSITGSSANVAVTVANGAGSCSENCMFNAAGGLVGVNVGGSSIVNSHAHGNVIGGARTCAGGLVGQNGFFFPEGAFGTITNSYASGNVTVTGEQSAAGGLVGSNTPGSTITNSQAFGNVASTSGFDSKAGGLVGENSGIITSTTTPNILTSNCAIGASFSCATGNVSVGMIGSGGGLVGSNNYNGTIERSFAIGNVNGASGLGDTEAATRLGGLAGSNSGEISDSLARGTVGSIDANFLVAGGLVGDNSGTILNSKASGNVLTGTFSMAGGLVGAHFPDTRTASLSNNSLSSEGNSALIKNSAASGNVSVGNASYGGGLIGASIATIENSVATGTVIGRANALVGGFAGANAGDISGSHATGNVTTVEGLGGGFVGLNVGWIQLSFAKGNVSSSGLAVLGGFVGMNAGEINQAYAIGTTSGAAGGYLGGFVGLNLNSEIVFHDAGFGSDAQNGKISQSYALGPVTGSNAVVAGGFAALNFGSLDQVYGVGHVQGAATLGGLVGANNGTATVPDRSSPHTVSGTGTATNSYWDMQTTAQTKSAGGTGMNTAVLAGGVPAGFDPAVWDSHSYPFLVALNNPPLPPQDTNPLPPVIPPVGVVNDPFLPPPDQQINPSSITAGPSSDPVPNVTSSCSNSNSSSNDSNSKDSRA